MRLTLRTLLAYLDDQLDAPVAVHFEQRLATSQSARGIADRILSTRCGQGAGALGLNGLGFDPNTVAEYLDNVMPVERVADFEALCLKSSDLLLDEVSDCHRMLVEATTSRATLSESLRRRIHDLEPAGGRDTPAPAPPASEAPIDFDMADTVDDFGDVFSDDLVDDFGDFSLDRGAQAPHELRTAWSRESGAATVAKPLAAAGTAGAPASHAAARKTGRATVAGARTGALQLDKRTRNVVTHGAAFAAGIAITLAAAWLAFRQTEHPPRPGADVAVADPPNPVAPPPADSTAATLVGSPAVLNSADAAEFPVVAPEAERREQIAADPRPADALGDSGPAEDEQPMQPALSEPWRTDRGASALESAPPADDIPVATALDACPGLLRLESGTWRAVPAGHTLCAGDRLLALPGFRPRIEFDARIQCELVGPCSLELPAPEADGRPRVIWRFGRGVVSIERGSRSVDLDFGAATRVVFFLSGRDTALAFEAYDYLPPGVEPAAHHRQRTLRFVALGNTVQCILPGKTERESLGAGEFRVFVDAQPRRSGSGPIPGWAHSTAEHGAAVQHLANAMAQDLPVVDELVAIAGGEPARGAARAAECLAYLGVFDQPIEMLGNPHAHREWPAIVDALKGAIAQDPNMAARVRASCERLGPDDARLAYQLLAGFSHDMLGGGEAVRLAGLLDSPSLTIRVLAFENLRRITGRTLLYRPHVDPSQRAAKSELWREWAASGSLVHPKHPTPLDVLDDL